MDLTGTDINLFQGLDEKKNPIDPGGLTDIAAGIGAMANSTAQAAYSSAGGDAALKKASDLAGRKGKTSANLKAKAAKSAGALKVLKGASRILPGVAVGLELFDAGVSAFKCLGASQKK